MSTNPPKLADLQLEYEQAPSLLKGDSPGKERKKVKKKKKE